MKYFIYLYIAISSSVYANNKALEQLLVYKDMLVYDKSTNKTLSPYVYDPTSGDILPERSLQRIGHIMQSEDRVLLGKEEALKRQEQVRSTILSELEPFQNTLLYRERDNKLHDPFNYDELGFSGPKSPEQSLKEIKVFLSNDFQALPMNEAINKYEEREWERRSQVYLGRITQSPQAPRKISFCKKIFKTLFGYM